MVSPPTSAVPEALLDLQRRVDAALERSLAEPLDRLRERSSVLGPAADELEGFLAGGKRIRPSLLLLGFQAAGGHALEVVDGPALALELLHTFALMHDDVIDRAPTRRGRESVHYSFARQHREAGWPGDPVAYGEAMAILLGDLAFVQADELFMQAQVPANAVLTAFRRFTVLREEVMVGQTLDLHVATSGTTERDLALTIATLKSGRYSVARPLEIGALLAGAPAELVDGLGAFGDPLGRAFQVRDDLLGVFGDGGQTGKSTASDLAEGKRTLLIAEAHARLDPPQRAEFDRHLGDPDLDATSAARLRELLTECGAREATERYVQDTVAQSRRVLEDLEVPRHIRATLAEVATWLGARAN